MKTLLIITTVLMSFAIRSQSYELMGTDTLNLTDAGGKKQGKWVKFGRYNNVVCGSTSQKVEEGLYKDNKKEGIWTDYFCSGNLRNKTTYTNGRPDGYKIIYRENGTILAEGNWKFNQWIGKHTVVCENGKVIEFMCD